MSKQLLRKISDALGCTDPSLKKQGTGDQASGRASSSSALAGSVARSLGSEMERAMELQPPGQKLDGIPPPPPEQPAQGGQEGDE